MIQKRRVKSEKSRYSHKVELAILSDYLLEKYFHNTTNLESEIHLLLGVASFSRPGPRYEGKNQEIANNLVETTRRWSKKIGIHGPKPKTVF